MSTLQVIINEIKADGFIDPSVDIHDGTSFVADLGYDSLDMLETVKTMEDAFDIVIYYEELGNVSTVGDLVHLVDTKLNKE